MSNVKDMSIKDIEFKNYLDNNSDEKNINTNSKERRDKIVNNNNNIDYVSDLQNKNKNIHVHQK